MRTDPIAEIAREVGQKYIGSFNGDWKALADDLNRRAESEGPPTDLAVTGESGASIPTAKKAD